MSFALIIDETVAAIFVSEDQANIAKALCLSEIGGFDNAYVTTSFAIARYDDAIEWFFA